MLVLISSLCHLCSWSRKSRSLEDSMAIDVKLFPKFHCSLDQPTHENHENWYPTNKSDLTVTEIYLKVPLNTITHSYLFSNYQNTTLSSRHIDFRLHMWRKFSLQKKKLITKSVLYAVNHA